MKKSITKLSAILAFQVSALAYATPIVEPGVTEVEDLNGSYLGMDCQVDPNQPGKIWHRDLIKIDGNISYQLQVVYSQADCKGAIIQFLHMTDSDIYKSLKEGVFNIDTHSKKSYVKTLRKNQTDWANKTQLCGMSDWETDVFRDITGLSCVDDTGDKGTYDIISVGKNGCMWLGLMSEDVDGSTPAKRPTELEFSGFCKID